MRRKARPTDGKNRQNELDLFFRNFVNSKLRCHTLVTSMADQPESTVREVPAESKLVNRPFRVKLRGAVLVLIRLPNRRDVRAAFHQLSTTGGVIHLEKPLDEKIEVQLVFHIGETTIRGKAQMLFPMWATQGWMQPFRFVDLSDAGRESLDANLKSFMSGASSGAAAGV
jgi:hypothetical protein